MADTNRHGLTRYIPANVSRQIRINSKFGCVLCRKGFYQYEHIDPTFEDAKEHNADAMCCLCGACHDAVTRGQISKGAIKAAYSKIKYSSPDDVEPPVGPLDFHDGTAELKIGNLLYSPAVHTVLRYHDQDIIKVIPGQNGEPGKISAIFTNDNGDPLLELNDNEWIGSLESWDIEVKGARITVKSAQGKVALKIRLDPPGRVTIERLDMRIGNGHVIATEDTYAVGRYVSENEAVWLHASIRITKAFPSGEAIEFTEPETLEKRDLKFMNTGQELATADRSIVMNSNAGVYVKPIGIVVSSLCGAFELGQFACGRRKVSDLRDIILTKPDQLSRFIGTGSIE
ncbi:MAG: hypothetical protein ACOYLR_10835 [Chlorobium sp.]